MKQTLANEFWGLYKTMNCKFPLTIIHNSKNDEIHKKYWL